MQDTRLSTQLNLAGGQSQLAEASVGLALGCFLPLHPVSRFMICVRARVRGRSTVLYVTSSVWPLYQVLTRAAKPRMPSGCIFTNKPSLAALLAFMLQGLDARINLYLFNSPNVPWVSCSSSCGDTTPDVSIIPGPKSQLTEIPYPPCLSSIDIPFYSCPAHPCRLQK